MSKYTDDDIRNKTKITCQIAGDYLGISANAVSIGMRNNLLPIMKKMIGDFQRVGHII